MGQWGILKTLGRRFLLSKSSDGFISLISWVSITGIAIGVLALVIVTSVINGFEGELSHVITGMNGDVILYSRGDPIDSPDIIETKIKEVVPETLYISPSFVSEIMVSGSSGTVGGVLEGFDRFKTANVTAVTDRVVEGRLPFSTDEVALGDALSDRIGAKVGSEIRLIIPFTPQTNEDLTDTEASYGPPRATPAKVVGIIKMGMYEYDSKFIFAELNWVRDFLGYPGKATAFKLKLKPFTDSRQISDRLNDNFGYPFRAKNWAQLNRNLFYAIQLEKAVIAIILTVIILVAAFNVVSTLMMMIHDKTKEIAILKAMGFRPIQGFGLFVYLGLGMGILGTGIGVSLGLFSSFVLSRTRLVELPADIYYIGFLPVRIEWSEVLWIAILAMGIALLATLYPAWKVSTRPTLEGIRYE